MVSFDFRLWLGVNIPVVRVFLDTCCSFVSCNTESEGEIFAMELMVRFLSACPVLEGHDDIMG